MRQADRRTRSARFSRSRAADAIVHWLVVTEYGISDLLVVGPGATAQFAARRVVDGQFLGPPPDQLWPQGAMFTKSQLR